MGQRKQSSRVTARVTAAAVASTAPVPGRTPPAAIVVDAVRHAVPLGQFYFFGGSLGNYLLLTAFDLAVGLVFIIGSTRERGDVNSVDPRSRMLSLQVLSVLVIAPFIGVTSAIIAMPIAMPAYLFGVQEGLDWPGIYSELSFWMQVGWMSLLAAARYQILFYQRTSAGSLGSRRAQVRSSATSKGIAAEPWRTTPPR